MLRVCSACGTENLESDKFCQECGRELEEDFLFCAQCGARNPQINNSCCNCGATLYKLNGTGAKVLRKRDALFRNEDLRQGILAALVGSIITLLLGMASAWAIRSYLLNKLVSTLGQPTANPSIKGILDHYFLGTYNVYGLLHSVPLTFSGMGDLNLAVNDGLNSFNSTGHVDFALNIFMPIVFALIVPILTIIIGWVIANILIKQKHSYQNVLLYSFIYAFIVAFAGIFLNTSYSQNLNLQDLFNLFGRSSRISGSYLSPQSSFVLKTGFVTGFWSMFFHNLILALFLVTGLHFIQCCGKRFIHGAKSYFEDKLGNVGSGIISSINVYLVLLAGVAVCLAWLSLTKNIFGPTLKSELTDLPRQANLAYWLLVYPIVLFDAIPLILGGGFSGTVVLPQFMKTFFGSGYDTYGLQSVSLSLFQGLAISGQHFAIPGLDYIPVLIAVAVIIIAGYIGNKRLGLKDLLVKSFTFACCFSLIANILASMFKLGIKADFSNLKLIVNGSTDLVRLPSSDAASILAGNSFGTGLFLVLAVVFLLYICGGFVALLLHSRQSSGSHVSAK